MTAICLLQGYYGKRQYESCLKKFETICRPWRLRHRQTRRLSTPMRLKVFRLKMAHAGFMKAWQERDYQITGQQSRMIQEADTWLIK